MLRVCVSRSASEMRRLLNQQAEHNVFPSHCSCGLGVEAAQINVSVLPPPSSALKGNAEDEFYNSN